MNNDEKESKILNICVTLYDRVYPIGERNSVLFQEMYEWLYESHLDDLLKLSTGQLEHDWSEYCESSIDDVEMLND